MAYRQLYETSRPCSALAYRKRGLRGSYLYAGALEIDFHSGIYLHTVILHLHCAFLVSLVVA